MGDFSVATRVTPRAAAGEFDVDRLVTQATQICALRLPG